MYQQTGHGFLVDIGGCSLLQVPVLVFIAIRAQGFPVLVSHAIIGKTAVF